MKLAESAMAFEKFGMSTNPAFVIGFIALSILEQMAKSYFFSLPSGGTAGDSNSSMPINKPFDEPPIKNFLDLQNLFKKTLKAGYFVPFISFFIPTIRLSPYTFLLTLIIQTAARNRSYMRRIATLIYPLTVTIETYETASFWVQYFVSSILSIFNTGKIFSLQTGIEIVLHLLPLIILYTLKERNKVVMKFSLLHIPILFLVAMVYGVNCCKATLTMGFFKVSLGNYYTELIAFLLYLSSLSTVYIFTLNLVGVNLVFGFFRSLVRFPFRALFGGKHREMALE